MDFLLVIVLNSLFSFSSSSLSVDREPKQCLDSCSHASPACSEESEDDCPPAMFCENSSCVCGVYPNRFISCDGAITSVLRYNCVTFDKTKNLTVVGSCMHSMKTVNFRHNYAGDTLYHQLPESVYGLDDLMCASLNRTGLQCGSCQPGLYPLAYSFSSACVRCPGAHWNWFRYIMAAYLPLTLFYVIILFFKVNITSSHLFAVVFYCQTLSMPMLLRSIDFHLHEDTSSSFQLTTNVFLSLYGIWNLDFFRPFYSNLCLRIHALPLLALDFVVAMYPLLLMLITYLLIAFHDKNYRVVTIVWSPFQKLLSLFKRNWEIKTSVIDAFATFFLLSNSKFLSVSFDMLVPTKVYYLHPNNYTYTLRLFYSPDVEYFGREHLPYAILAIVILCIFVILPIIVFTLYLFNFFQKFLSIFPFRWYILHTFVDTFQGCYKDGTEPGTRDCRWCVSAYFIYRLSLFLLFSQSDHVIFLALSTLAIIFYSTLLAALQPFKPIVAHYNEVYILFLQFLILLSISGIVVNFSVFMSPQFVPIFTILTNILGALPLCYVIAIILNWICKHKKFGLNVIRTFIARKKGYNLLPGQNEP